MEINKATELCSSRGIEVYPIQVGNSHRFKIQINERGKLRTYSKEVVEGLEPAKAMAKVYIKLANEINKE
jgi:hypothetical protein